MRKKLLSLVAIATIVFFGACSNEELLPEPEQTFTFSASMPQKKSPTSSIALNDPTTRVALEEVDKDIVLTWETDDILEVVATQIDGTILGTGTANIIPESISSDGKKAKFTTSAPLPTGTFNFYGVYGGRGLSSTNALLPLAPSTSGSLDEVQNNKDVMLYFAHENTSQAELTNGVTLNHLGSLFMITVQNNCETGTLDLQQALLEGVNNNDNLDWAYNFAETGTVFDLSTQSFQNTGTGINSIAFTTNTEKIAPGEEVTYWSWYPILPGNTWPELKFRMINANPSGELVTVNSKPARITQTNPVVAGKNYRFYAEFDGDDLNFTNDQFEVPAP